MGRARGLAIAGSAGLTAAFAALVASSPPGKANVVARVHYTPVASRHGVSARAAVHTAAPSLPPLASASALGLQAPAQTPDAAAPSSHPAAAPSASATAPAAASSASATAPAAASSAPAPATQSAPAAAPTPQPAPVVSGGS